MFCWSRALLVALTCAATQAHVVSISNGELRVAGQTATFELRIPTYEVEALANPETMLFDEFRFEGGKRNLSECKKDPDWLTCRASYEFAEPVRDRIQVECTLYRVTVPNHIHILYAVQGENSDQRVFDQNTPAQEMRFHPPSLRESVVRDGSAGVLRLLKSPAGLLFLLVIALAARSLRDTVILGASFLAAEWALRPLSPFIPLALSPEFLEAVMALTVAYLAGELVLLPGGSARWVVVPALGLIHGLPFVGFPAFYLGGASVLQAGLIAMASYGALRMPRAWRKPASALLLATAMVWFARLVFAT